MHEKEMKLNRVGLVMMEKAIVKDNEDPPAPAAQSYFMISSFMTTPGLLCTPYGLYRLYRLM